MSTDAQAFAREIWDRAYLPPPLLTVAQWADQNRRLSTKETGVPGPWSTSRVPYLRKIMDALSPGSLAETIVFQKGAQIGGSEAGLNWLGFSVDRDPCPIMLVMPTIETGRDYSRQRLEEMLRQTPCLHGKVAARRDPAGGSTQLVKEFPGGLILVRGSNSPSGLRSNPIKKLLLEEVDAYEPSAGQEGDPVVLAQMRTATFRRRKVFMVSTPKRQGTSRIASEFARCEQAYDYHVPCPLCGHRQALVWDRMHYAIPAGWSLENDVGELVEIPGVTYECAQCGDRFGEHHKARLLAAGDWVPRWPARGEKSVAFHLSALYSPWFSWGRCAAMHERGKQRPEEMQVWVNTVLGLPYEEPSEVPDWERLHARRESYPRGLVPAGVRVLTAGIDVQHDRLEYEVVGWGRDRRSWSIDYRSVPCAIAGEEPVTVLRDILEREWACIGGGTLRIWAAAIDSSDNSQTVYTWVRQFPQPRFGGTELAIRQPGTLFAIKGRDAWGPPLLPPQKVSAEERKRGLRVVGVSTWTLKQRLYLHLRLRGATADEHATGIDDPHGFCRFPEYDEEWFKQLTAERLVRSKDRKGYERHEWVKTRVRNEALDCRVYAMAAASACGLERMSPRDFERIEAQLPPGLLAKPGVAPAAPPPSIAEGQRVAQAVPAQATPSPSLPRRPTVIRSSWMGRFR